MKQPMFSRPTAEAASLENSLTPLEIAELRHRPGYSHLPFAIAPLLDAHPPVRYVRSKLCEQVQFYSARLGAPNLVVAFCGGAHRLMMPISFVLQLTHLHSDHLAISVRSRCRAGSRVGPCR
jgi:hypothetical protein